MTVKYIDNFLSTEDMQQFTLYIKEKQVSQQVIQDSTFVNYFWEHYGERIREIEPNCIGITPSVTLTQTSTPISRHVDINHHGERYKVLIYLNDIPNGGTLFYPSSGTQLVENKANRLVLFDMSILHESQKFNTRACRTRKIAIGFRLFGKD
jgi:hypothetical protein